MLVPKVTLAVNSPSAAALVRPALAIVTAVTGLDAVSLSVTIVAVESVQAVAPLTFAIMFVMQIFLPFGTDAAGIIATGTSAAALVKVAVNLNGIPAALATS